METKTSNFNFFDYIKTQFNVPYGSPIISQKLNVHNIDLNNIIISYQLNKKKEENLEMIRGNIQNILNWHKTINAQLLKIDENIKNLDNQCSSFLQTVNNKLDLLKKICLDKKAESCFDFGHLEKMFENEQKLLLSLHDVILNVNYILNHYIELSRNDESQTISRCLNNDDFLNDFKLSNGEEVKSASDS